MTIEKAIKMLKSKMDGHTDTSYEWCECVRMAIKALEQEPKLLQALEQEKGAYNALVKNIQCSDCISRQAVLDMMQMRMGGKELYKAVYNLPSVKQEPKKGHWEWVQYDGNSNIGNWHCTECGSIVIACVSKEYKGGISYKYCPNCGAKME